MHEDLPGEEWRGLAAYPGYEWSSLGRARSFWRLGGYPVITETPRILKLQYDRGGYANVMVCVNKKKILLKVHRLVLETFVGPCPEGMECLHRDHDKKHNQVDNLRWGTHQENMEDRRLNSEDGFRGSIGEGNWKAKLTDERAREIFLARKAGRDGASLGREHGVSSATIYNIANRKAWKHVTTNL